MNSAKSCIKKIQKNAHHRILFTNEKIFNIEEKFSSQNDHIYAKSCYEPKDKSWRVQRGHHSSPFSNCWVGSFVLWWYGVKTNGEIDWAVLNDVLPSLEKTVFADEDEWGFQWDSVPTHKVKKMLKWLQEHFLDYITADDWPSYGD